MTFKFHYAVASLTFTIYLILSSKWVKIEKVIYWIRIVTSVHSMNLHLPRSRSNLWLQHRLGGQVTPFLSLTRASYGTLSKAVNLCLSLQNKDTPDLFPVLYFHFNLQAGTFYKQDVFPGLHGLIYSYFTESFTSRTRLLAPSSALLQFQAVWLSACCIAATTMYLV